MDSEPMNGAPPVTKKAARAAIIVAAAPMLAVVGATAVEPFSWGFDQTHKQFESVTSLAEGAAVTLRC
jgi:hypothetical protein